MSEFRPITTLEDLLIQDEGEVTAGYWAGRRGDPEPGNLHSRAYWHGWRNGMADAGRVRMDRHQHTLRVEVASRVMDVPRLQ